MVSQPSKSNDVTTLHEEALHPPQHSISLPSTSEDQRPIITAVDDADTVDLSKDTEVNELKKLGELGGEIYVESLSENNTVAVEKGKRELPLSMRLRREKKTVFATCSKNGLFSHLLDDLNMFGEDDFEDVDFLQTAKKRGLIFPRPRWWPSKGFDD